MRCGISAKRLIIVSLSKAYSICALTLRTPISDNRVLPIVERRKFFILFIALKDRSACAEVTGIVTEMCKTLFITLRTRLWGVYWVLKQLHLRGPLSGCLGYVIWHTIWVYYSNLNIVDCIAWACSHTRSLGKEAVSGFLTLRHDYLW